MRLKWKLFAANLKMFFRQREAIIWTIIMPLFMVSIFGFVTFDGIGRVDVGVVNEAGLDASGAVEALRSVQTLRLHEGERGPELTALEKGDRDLVLVIHRTFTDGTRQRLTTFTNDARPQESQLGLLLLQRVFDEMVLSRVSIDDRVSLDPVPVKSRNVTYIDFLLPGIVAMAIMQMGIFGVSFSFVQLKKRGILRRLWVTPVSAGDFIIAQVAMRMVVVMLQISVLIGAGVLFFDLHFVGSFVDLFVLGMLGAIVFLGMGFAIAGVSKSEDQVAPLANIVSLPLLLLSGVFFSRTNLPGFIHTLTDYSPLTYLADGMRGVAIDGAGMMDIGPQLLGLAVWFIQKSRT
jgi:ABC-2 type transport system permease protein